MKQAREFYTEVYGVDVSYREVAEKLNQLGRRRIVYLTIAIYRLPSEIMILFCSCNSQIGNTVMSAKLSVIFYIILCLEIGMFLTVLPWWPQGMWGMTTGEIIIFCFMLHVRPDSGPAGGGCFGLGSRRGERYRLLNLGIAFWEIFNFKQHRRRFAKRDAVASKKCRYNCQRPIIYPITSGETTPQTTPDDPEFSQINCSRLRSCSRC